MNCEDCKAKRQEEIPASVLHERDMARAARANKSLVTVIIILIIALVATNAGWLYYESQFEDTVTTIEADTTDGGTAIANGEGSVTYNGESESNNAEARP